MNKPAIALSAAVIIAGATAIYLYQELQTELDRNALLDERIAQLESARSAAALTTEPLDPVPPVRGPTESLPPPTKVIDNGPPPIPQRGRPQNGPRERFNDPQARAAMRNEQKIRLMRAYPDLAATLHLGPGETDKFFELLADNQMKSMELRDSLRDKNLSREEFTAEMRRSSAAQTEDRDRQIAALLGDAKAQEWKDYQNTLGARTQVRELSTILESSGMPLRSDQSQTLIGALAAEQNRYATEQQAVTAQRDVLQNVDPTQRVAMFEQNLARQEQHVQRSHDALAPYLTSEQLKRYDEINNQQLENQRLNLQRLRERAANGFPTRN